MAIFGRSFTLMPVAFSPLKLSKKAHKELLRRAISDGRTIIKQLEVILGV
ncbi:MAG: hypothetical protein J0I47_06150 [Sphingomonas sp.]|nr:hypothetical protein [Sphingomonas sp.]